MTPFAIGVPLFAALAAATFSSVAAEPTIEDACLRAAEHYFHAEGLEPSKVQAFPELNPPRVLLFVSGAGLPLASHDAVASLLSGVPAPATNEPRTIGPVACDFESASAPFGLVSFDCAGMACLPTDERIEEIRALLNREGL